MWPMHVVAVVIEKSAKTYTTNMLLSYWIQEYIGVMRRSYTTITLKSVVIFIFGPIKHIFGNNLFIFYAYLVVLFNKFKLG